MHFFNMVAKIMFVKGGMFTPFTLESPALSMHLGIVVVKLGFVNCCEGTVVTEEGLPIRAWFCLLLVKAMFSSHVEMKQLIPGGGEITFVTNKHFLFMFRVNMVVQVW